MKIVRLKKRFIELCVKKDSEFLEKNSRPYVIEVKCRKTGKQYAIPMTSSKKRFSFKLSKDSYLNFEKAFIIENYNIVQESYIFADEEEYLHYELKKQSRAIESTFNRYLLSHPERFSVNENAISKLQKLF